MKKFTVSRDDSTYHAWPDVALTKSGKLVCVFTQCRDHFDRGPTRVMVVTSRDRGRSWTPKRAVTEVLERKTPEDPVWNCPRISALSDGRLVVVVDRVGGTSESVDMSNWLWFSGDDGETWDGPVATPIEGVVPDQLIELKHGPHAGRWLISAQTNVGPRGKVLKTQWCWWSDDSGRSWQVPAIVGQVPSLQLCEGSIVPLQSAELVCFMRENSGCGLDAFKSISTDGGVTWGPVTAFPLPGCHRPVAGVLQSGRVMVTYRFLQGPARGRGWSTQNFFAGITDVASCLSSARDQAHARIMPLDYDRSPVADLGYSGWVQFSDGEIYIVQYLVDDAPFGQIRGYAMSEQEFYLGDPSKSRW